MFHVSDSYSGSHIEESNQFEKNEGRNIERNSGRRRSTTATGRSTGATVTNAGASTHTGYRATTGAGTSAASAGVGASGIAGEAIATSSDASSASTYGRRPRSRSTGTSRTSSGEVYNVSSSESNEAPSRSRSRKSSRRRNNENIDNTSEPQKKHRGLVWLKRIMLALLCLLLIGILAACAFVYNIIKDTPPIDPQSLYDHLAETTKMYDADGKEIDTIYMGFNRELANVNDMPENLTDAVIALEDKTFRTHHGFNIIRIFGAIRDALFSGGQISGTSTITQQLARNIYLTEKQFDHDYTRKIQEAYYALRLEKELSKDEIIGAYLNTIYFITIT